MAIDIYANNVLEMITFVISNMRTQTVILNNVTGSGFLFNVAYAEICTYNFW